MAKIEKIITIQDLQPKMFHIGKLESGAWGMWVDLVEVDTEGNELRRGQEYAELPNKVAAKWEAIVEHVLQQARQTRGLDDGVAEVSAIKTSTKRKGKRKR